MLEITILKHLKRRFKDIYLVQDNKYVNTPNRKCFPDVVINNRVVIQCQGDFWHMNPSIYKYDDINPKTLRSAQDI